MIEQVASQLRQEQDPRPAAPRVHPRYGPLQPHPRPRGIVVVAVHRSPRKQRRVLGPGRLLAVARIQRPRRGRVGRQDPPAEGPQAAHDGADLADAHEGDNEEHDRAAAAAVDVLVLGARQLRERRVGDDAEEGSDLHRHVGPVPAPHATLEVPEQGRAHEAQQLRDAREDRGEDVRRPALLLQLGRRVARGALAESVADEVCVNEEGDEEGYRYSGGARDKTAQVAEGDVRVDGAEPDGFLKKV